MTRGTLFQIQRFSTHDGPGIRSTAFLKGCPLACAWCHNPESQAFEPELLRAPERCIRCGSCWEACPEECRPDRCTACGACADVCPAEARSRVGRSWEASELVSELLRDRAFFEESGGGVTLSGGEPLAQPDFVREVLERLQAEEIHRVLDTCGVAPEADLLDIARRADLILFDLKGWDAERHRAMTGAEPQPIRENLQALDAHGIPSWVRIPVVPGATDDPEGWEALGDFLRSLRHLGQVSLLPYHELGRSKGQRLGRDDFQTFQKPDPAHLEHLAGRLRQRGLTVKIGG